MPKKSTSRVWHMPTVTEKKFANLFASEGVSYFVDTHLEQEYCLEFPTIKQYLGPETKEKTLQVLANCLCNKNIFTDGLKANCDDDDDDDEPEQIDYKGTKVLQNLKAAFASSDAPALELSNLLIKSGTKFREEPIKKILDILSSHSDSAAPAQNFYMAFLNTATQSFTKQLSAKEQAGFIRILNSIPSEKTKKTLAAAVLEKNNKPAAPLSWPRARAWIVNTFPRICPKRWINAAAESTAFSGEELQLLQNMANPENKPSILTSASIALQLNKKIKPAVVDRQIAKPADDHKLIQLDESSVAAPTTVITTSVSAQDEHAAAESEDSLLIETPDQLSVVSIVTATTTLKQKADEQKAEDTNNEALASRGPTTDAEVTETLKSQQAGSSNTAAPKSPTGSVSAENTQKITIGFKPTIEPEQKKQPENQPNFDRTMPASDEKKVERQEVVKALLKHSSIMQPKGEQQQKDLTVSQEFQNILVTTTPGPYNN